MHLRETSAFSKIIKLSIICIYIFYEDVEIYFCTISDTAAYETSSLSNAVIK